MFDKNQPRSCFVCCEAGHEARNCPRKVSSARTPDPPPGTRSFMKIAAGAKPPVVPILTNVVTSDPPSTVESGLKLNEDDQPMMVVEESAANVVLEIVPPLEGESMPPPPPLPPVSPAMSAVDLASSFDLMVVPPAGDENLSLP